MRLTHRYLLLVTLFLLLICHFTVCGPQYPELWDWRERQRRRLERQSRRLAHSGIAGGNKSSLRIQPLDDNEIAEPPTAKNATIYASRDEDSESEEEEVEVDDDVPILNVTDDDSPYALINKFFPDRELNHRRMQYDFETAASNDDALVKDVSPLKPREVWLADGDLLVLKGGSTPDRDGVDNPWKPLDDYEAPYREPKLPPPDFIPDDTGVGVPLPPEDDDVVSNSIDVDQVAAVKTIPDNTVKTLVERPAKLREIPRAKLLEITPPNLLEIEPPKLFDNKPPKLFDDNPVKLFEDKPVRLFEDVPDNFFPYPKERNFDEDDFIRQMENFHFFRFSDIVARHPNLNPFFSKKSDIPSTTTRPRVPIRTTPSVSTFSYQYQTQSKNQPIASPLVMDKPRQPLPRQITTSTTARTTTTTTQRTTTTQKSRSTTTAKPLAATIFKELTVRAPKSNFPRFSNNNNEFQQTPPQSVSTDFQPKIPYTNRQNSQLEIETNEIGDERVYPQKFNSFLNRPDPMRLSRDQNRVRRRPTVFAAPRPNINQGPSVRAPKQFTPLTIRPLDSNTIRRNGAGHYTTYFQGNVGGKTWSYSYKL